MNLLTVIKRKKILEKLIEKSHGKIEFRNVSFSYATSKDTILNEINFSAQAGETVALVGRSGSGKSTLVSLLAQQRRAILPAG